MGYNSRDDPETNRKATCQVRSTIDSTQYTVGWVLSGMADYYALTVVKPIKYPAMGLG